VTFTRLSLREADRQRGDGAAAASDVAVRNSGSRGVHAIEAEARRAGGHTPTAAGTTRLPEMRDVIAAKRAGTQPPAFLRPDQAQPPSEEGT
jgi:hypothetical protein